MQQTNAPSSFLPVRRKRGIATTSGLSLAILGAIIIFGIGIISGFHSISGTSEFSQVAAWLILFALFGTPLLAGLVGTLRSGHLGTGTLSGLWSGFLVGLCLAIYIIILYLTNAPTQVSPESARQAQNVLAQQGIQISMQSIQANAMRRVSLTGLVIADVILVLLWLGIGAVLGVIGGAIGKIFVRQPRDYVVPAAAAAPHYDETPPQEQYVEPSPNYTAPPVEEPPTEPAPQEEARATEDSTTENSYTATPSARSSLDEVPPQES
jgi:hypothetical protein